MQREEFINKRIQEHYDYIKDKYDVIYLGLQGSQNYELDVYDNENEIIYQIKRAIYYGSTKKLYKDDSDVYDFQVRDFVKPPSKPSKRLTTETEIKDYFGDIVI